jgi:hypothetical protein
LPEDLCPTRDPIDRGYDRYYADVAAKL